MRDAHAPDPLAAAGLSVASLTLDLDTGRALASPGLSRLLGLPEGTALTVDTLAERVHPDDRPTWRAAVERLGPEGGDYERGFRTVSSEGTTRSLIEHGRLARDTSGRRVLVATLAEADTVGTERLFRLALSTAPTTVFSQDRALRYTWVHNPQAGFDAAAVLGCSDAELLSEETATPLAALKRGVMESGLPARATVQVRPKLGTEESVHDLSVEPLCDEAGAVVGVLCASTDVTDHHRAAEAAREAEARFRASVESLMDAFGIYAAIRDETGAIVDFRVEYVNEAACRANRMSREEQVGHRLGEILPGHHESGLMDAYRRLVETGEPVRREQQVYEDEWAGQRLVRAFDISATKHGDGFVAAWRDVTDRRRDAQALEAAQAQSELLRRELEHRIANNLTLLSSLLSLETRTADPAAHPALEKARRQLELVASLHAHLRTTGREAGRVDLGAYLESVCEALAASYGVEARGVALLVEAETVSAPASMAINLGLVINELVTNAVKYAFAGRQRGAIRVRLDRTAQGIALTIADDGIGFDVAAAPQGGGSGRRLVEQLARGMDAALEVASSAAGTRWQLVLDVSK